MVIRPFYTVCLRDENDRATPNYLDDVSVAALPCFDPAFSAPEPTEVSGRLMRYRDSLSVTSFPRRNASRSPL